MERLRRAAFWACASAARAAADRDRGLTAPLRTLLVLVFGAAHAELDDAGLLTLLAGRGWDAAAMPVDGLCVAPVEYARTAYVFVCTAAELDAFDARPVPLAPAQSELCERIFLSATPCAVTNYRTITLKSRRPEYVLLNVVRPYIENHVDAFEMGDPGW